MKRGRKSNRFFNFRMVFCVLLTLLFVYIGIDRAFKTSQIPPINQASHNDSKREKSGHIARQEYKKHSTTSPVGDFANIQETQTQLMPESPHDLQELHRQQNEDFDYLKNNPEFEDMSGMQNMERWTMHAEQNEQYVQLKNNPNFISELDGITNQQRWEMHQKQQNELDNIKKDPNFLDMNYVSNAERQTLHKEQYARYIEMRNDPDFIDSLNGVSNSELSEMHKKQYEQFQMLKKSQ